MIGAIQVIQDECRTLAERHADIQVILLVGSYARGAQTAESDIDLVLITDRWEEYLRDAEWMRIFGKESERRVERYGLLTSVRAFFAGREIEFGFCGTEWICEPLDPGTARVLSDGYVVLYDKMGVMPTIRTDAARGEGES